MQAFPQRYRKAKESSTTQNAAALLWQVRKIAIREVHQVPGPLTKPTLSPLVPVPVPMVTSSVLSYSFTENSEDSSSDADSWFELDTPSSNSLPTAAKRCRLISVCSQDDVELTTRTRKDSFANQQDHFFFGTESLADSVQSYQDKKKALKNSGMCPVTPPPPNKQVKQGVTQNLVGTRVQGEVKDILRPKFSWRNFPELEKYLIDHRLEYLRYSSQRNYSAEQKQYNNLLTQGLLDLAEKDGYLFEGFSFAAVRDRIRCYYKSYVQAVKKKERKNKKRK